jgi:rhodanese-related sulfurtransferase
MGLLEVLFGKRRNMENVSKLIDDGAIIIDVRTPGEFQGGHVTGSSIYHYKRSRIE